MRCIGQLRDSTGTDKSCDFDGSQTGINKIVNQGYFCGGINETRFILQAIAGGDFDDANGLGNGKGGGAARNGAGTVVIGGIECGDRGEFGGTGCEMFRW